MKSLNQVMSSKGVYQYRRACKVSRSCKNTTHTQRERETITSYLKHPAVTNNMGDNAASLPSSGLGSITSHVCLLMLVSIHTAGAVRHKNPAFFLIMFSSVLITHASSPVTTTILTVHLPDRCHHNTVLYTVFKEQVSSIH